MEKKKLAAGDEINTLMRNISRPMHRELNGLGEAAVHRIGDDVYDAVRRPIGEDLSIAITEHPWTKN